MKRLFALLAAAAILASCFSAGAEYVDEDDDIPEDGVAIATLLHDVCKAEVYKPEVKRRKNFSGSISSLPQRAASTLMSRREVMRMMATERMTESAAMVKLVTIIT